MRAHGVILEDIRSNMKVVVEAVTSTRAELKADIASLEERLSERIAVLEGAVRQNSADIRKNTDGIRKNSDDIRKNSDDIRALREEVARLRHDFDHREELGRVGELETRVAAIEAHLGIGGR